jgi:hypothetical protein
MAAAGLSDCEIARPMSQSPTGIQCGEMEAY